MPEKKIKEKEYPCEERGCKKCPGLDKCINKTKKEICEKCLLPPSEDCELCNGYPG